MAEVICYEIGDMASSFLPAKLGFPIYKKSTFRYQFQWLDNNGKTKTPHDLTPYEGKAVLEGDDGSTLELSTANGGLFFGDRVLKEPKNGMVEIFIADKKQGGGPIGTEEITWQKAPYTLFVIETGTLDKLPLLAGQFHIVAQPL